MMVKRSVLGFIFALLLLMGTLAIRPVTTAPAVAAGQDSVPVAQTQTVPADDPTGL